MSEPQRRQPFRKYEGGNEVDPASFTPQPVAAGTEGKTIQDYYNEISGSVLMQDSDGSEWTRDGEPANDIAERRADAGDTPSFDAPAETKTEEKTEAPKEPKPPTRRSAKANDDDGLASAN